jgi:hypothetical protein
MSDLVIRRIVYGLLQAGVVEFIRAEGSNLPANIRVSQPVQNTEEQKSLVNRIIHRIRSL